MMNSRTFHQEGVSLVGLMVGLVISMITILAMLTVYKTTLRSASETGRGAATDGQRLSALFAAQTLLQEAGYGVASAAFGTDLVVIAGASLDSSSNQLSGSVVGGLPASGNAIIWGTKTATAYMCNGLYAPASGGLTRLPAIACTNASASWNSVVWTQTKLVDDNKIARAFMISVTQATGCKTFGIGGSGSLLVRLTTKNSYSVIHPSRAQLA